MVEFRALSLLTGIALLVGCTSDPNAPINQTFPIRQMDAFFRQYTGSPGPTRAYATAPEPAPAYTLQPGYAPAYPPNSSL
jgi:hypothetical protein